MKNLLAKKNKASKDFNLKNSWPLILVCLLAGAGAGAGATDYAKDRSEQKLLSQIIPVRENTNKYKFINPLLGYDIPNAKEFPEFNPLLKKINSFVQAQTSTGNASNISVYFRDLNMGRWMGINENEQYDPASMLKIVIMIAYYQQAQNNPGLLNQKITYTAALADDIDAIPFQTPSSLQTGKQYTIEQLIEAMIINSDNGAKNALLDNLNDTSLNEVYSDLGIQAPQDNQNYLISAKAYSVFLRTLYNATYLDREYSEKTLSLMSQATYKDGLVAGLPANIQAAQKFGEHITTNAQGQPSVFELNDCGIIYHPNRPYILCVMTRGNSITNLTAIIKDISSEVYQSVDSDYKN